MTYCETTTWITPSITVECGRKGDHEVHRGTSFHLTFEWKDGERPMKVGRSGIQAQMAATYGAIR